MALELQEVPQPVCGRLWSLQCPGTAEGGARLLEFLGD
jgi:hypothetical protein